MNGVFSKIVVAMSGTESSEAAAVMGLRLSKVHGAKVMLVNVVDLALAAEIARVMGRPQDQVLADMEKSGRGILRHGEVLGNQEGVLVSTALRRGSPHLEIVDEAESWGADLIIIGSTHVAGPRPLAIGRVVERVIEHSACPVLVVRRRAQTV
ncbi:MAG: universal stress protein [Chloroflexota bacterium]|jgi:nucleotide-binding universal stress UspA family protein